MKKLLLIIIIIIACEEPIDTEEIVIDGYLNKISYYVGEQAKLYINTSTKKESYC